MHLMVSIVQRNAGGESRVSRSTFVPSDVEEEDQDVDTVINSLQREAVEREIFNALVTNASDLVTAPARALERSLCVDISPTMELRFEQVRLRRTLVGTCSLCLRCTRRISIRLPSRTLIQKQTTSVT